MSPTAHLVSDRAFIRRAADWLAEPPEPPAPLLGLASLAFADTLSCAMAAVRTDLGRALEAFLVPRAGGPVPVPPWQVDASVEDAALVLGTLAHALEFDDIHREMMGHGSAVIVAAVSAWSVGYRASGSMRSAYLAGTEVGARLGRLAAPSQYRRGWHTTSTIGTVAATAAVARAAGLDADTTAAALGLSASMSSGLRANFASDAKAIHAGHAATCAVRSVELAMSGVGARLEAVDGPFGWLACLADGAPSVTLAFDDWTISPESVDFKVYPSCGATHRALDGLREAAGGALREVTDVQFLVSPMAYQLVAQRHPTTPSEARFSLTHAASLLILDGRLGLDQFELATLDRRDVHDLRDRISVRQAHYLATDEIGSAEVLVTLRDGTVHHARVDGPGQRAQRALSTRDLRDKHLECLRRLDPDRTWDPVLSAMAGLDAARDAWSLFQLLAQDVPRSRS